MNYDAEKRNQRDLLTMKKEIAYRSHSGVEKALHEDEIHNMHIKLSFGHIHFSENNWMRHKKREESDLT
jgi:hypothetical protein